MEELYRREEGREIVMKVCNKSRERRNNIRTAWNKYYYYKEEKIQILENESSKNRKTQIDHEQKSNYRDRIDRPSADPKPSVGGDIHSRWITPSLAVVI